MKLIAKIFLIYLLTVCVKNCLAQTSLNPLTFVDIEYSINAKSWYAVTSPNSLDPQYSVVYKYDDRSARWNQVVEFRSGYHLAIDSLNLYSYGGAKGYYEWLDVSDSLKHADSIPQADFITAFTVKNNLPAFAMVSNYNKNYLMQMQAGKWQVNPVMHYTPKPVWPQRVFLICIPLIILLLTYLLATNSTAATAIKKELNILGRTDNALHTKSERPLGIKGEDLLGFASVEEAIVRILRNTQLDLPMTIVVSGTWGSGKSSMMNRVKEKLEETEELKKRFITTWFNAWHVQGESSLLNSFLLNIVESYERHYNHGLSFFRVKLAYKRFLRLPLLKKFAFGFAIAVIAPFILAIIAKMFSIDNNKLIFLADYCNTLKGVFSFDDKKLFSLDSLPPIGALVLVILSIFFLNRQFIPAGLATFFELLPKNSFRLDAEKTEVGSRDKFKKEYWELMEAGRKETRMVVFIDDLDRIGGDKILELLEGMNFISDVASRPPGTSLVAPNTIFIMGMYTAEVAKNVGTQLNKVNGTSFPPEILGALYIEKMVQLIVPVPFDNSDKEKLKKLYEN